MEAMGKRVGDGFEKLGKTLEEKVDRRGKDFQNWWDHSLGILSPVVAGAFCAIVVLVLIFIADAIASASDHRQFWEELADFGLDNFLLLVGLGFFGSFNDYFNRRHKKTYRWIYPPVSGVLCVAWFWVLSQVLDITATTRGHPSLTDLSDFIELMLPVIFVLVLVIGYSVVFVRGYVVEKVAPGGQK